MREILYLNPVFKEMVWGGDRLQKEFGYDIPSERTGECWAVSAHPNGDCVVKEGTFQGMTLSKLWSEKPELFGNPGVDRFPLLVKIIDAKDDLSVQVHPDDTYAGEMENGSFGKTECWYVLDCPEGATIKIGHNAATKEELSQMIEQKQWSELLREIPVKKGDFIQIDPGTVHAIKGGCLILETQQNSDITYRLYDYDRQVDGKPRELHLQKSIDVIQTPAQPPEKSVMDTNNLPKNTMNQLISCQYYTVWKLDLTESFTLEQEHPFLIIGIAKGEGTIDGKPVQKGDNIVLPFGYGKAALCGEMQLIISAPAK